MTFLEEMSFLNFKVCGRSEAQKHHQEALRRYQAIYTTSSRLAELQLQKCHF